jgi:hypothetical protein
MLHNERLLRCLIEFDERVAAMADDLSVAVVTAALQQFGLAPLYAQKAAGDSRIQWTEDALAACQHDIETSTMRKPANALWSTYLQHGQIPPLPYSPPVDELRCPFSGCDAGGDLSKCHGIHGYLRLLPCLNCGKPIRKCWGRCPVKEQEEAAA